jgi:hypothetical protein
MKCQKKFRPDNQVEEVRDILRLAVRLAARVVLV